MSRSLFGSKTLKNPSPEEIPYFWTPPPDPSTESHGLTTLQTDFLYRKLFVKFLFQATRSLVYDFVRIDWRILQETKTLDLSHWLWYIVFLFVLGEWIHRPCNYTCEQKRLYTSFTPWHLTTSIQFKFPPFPTKNTITNHKSAVRSPDTSASQKNMFLQQWNLRCHQRQMFQLININLSFPSSSHEGRSTYPWKIVIYWSP